MVLAEMHEMVPCATLHAVIEPEDPKLEGAEHRPVGLERMLRIYFLLQWFNLSNPAMEEALYDSQAMRTFAEINLARNLLPNENTICRFRHLLEAHQLGPTLFKTVNAHLWARGLTVSRGTIVDATIIHVPSSTKNADQARNPEMHQTAKGL